MSKYPFDLDDDLLPNCCYVCKSSHEPIKLVLLSLLLLNLHSYSGSLPLEEGSKNWCRTLGTVPRQWRGHVMRADPSDPMYHVSFLPSIVDVVVFWLTWLNPNT